MKGFWLVVEVRPIGGDLSNFLDVISLYKSPEESLKIALAREVQDVKLDNYSPESMREFIRDSIANINGIYYVVSMRDQKY